MVVDNNKYGLGRMRNAASWLLWSALAATTKYTDSYFSQFWRLMSETKVLCGWLLVGAVFLLPDSWLLTVSSCGERALMSLFIKALIPLGGPTWGVHPHDLV